MDVGGRDYRKQKEALDQMCRLVTDTERALTRNKSIVQNSSANVRKLDQEIMRYEEDILKLDQAKKKLHEELLKNEEAGNKLLVDS